MRAGAADSYDMVNGPLPSSPGELRRLCDRDLTIGVKRISAA
jgi:hypothetical protein